MLAGVPSRKNTPNEKIGGSLLFGYRVSTAQGTYVDGVGSNIQW